MITRRWCLSCFEDFAEDTSYVGLCMACDYEHDRSIRLNQHSFRHQNDTPAAWWGPTMSDIDPDDIKFGFHEVTIGFTEEEAAWRDI